MNQVFFFILKASRDASTSSFATRHLPIIDEFDLRDDRDEMKIKQIKINKCHEILKDILFNTIFLWALFMVCYSVPKRGIFFYIQDILQNTLSDYENVKLLFIYLLRKYLKTLNKFKWSLI